MLHLFLIVLLLMLSAFFSGSETALFSLSNFQKKRIQSKNPEASKTISILLESPSRTLATILIGNMLVNITVTSLVTILAISIFGEKGIVVSIVFMTIILLIFGEVTPKTAAIRSPEDFSIFCAAPLHIFGKIIWPVRRVLRLIANVFISLFVFKRETKPYITQKELKALMSISKKEGVIEKEEEEMIRSIFDLGERSVDEIMTPRIDIVGCAKAAQASELIEIMKNSKHTKIPIYQGTIDRIEGIVYTKEFMLHGGSNISDFIRKPIFIPETEKIDELLYKFQSQKIHIAVVLDEFGGTSGIVTLEDILEEIVGEIRDEYDKDTPSIEKRDDGVFVITGKAAIRDVNEEVLLDLPMEEVTTINGFLLLLFGMVPKAGDFIKFKNAEFHIVEVKDNMVIKVHVKKI